MAKKEKSYGEILTAGFIKENPVLRLVLGTCPTLAVTTQAFNGLGMGAAATLVLIGSNAVGSYSGFHHNHRWFRNNYSDAC